MSAEPVPPLPDDILKALALEQARPPPPDALLELTRARIASTAGSLAASAGAGAVASGAATSLTTAKIVALVAAAALAGAVGGAGLHAALRPAPSSVQPIVIAVAPPPPAVAESPPAPAPPPAEPPPAKHAPKVPPPVAKPEPAPPAPTVETERLLIERAGVALSRGEAAAALAACDEHQRLFATGLLAEERESVAIRALAALGRTADARARAKAFTAAFPTSMQRPIIDQVLKSDAGVTETTGGHK